MSQGIKSKVVVITGASSGIGAASARYLAARGAVVSLAARRKDKLDVLVGEIVKAGGKAQAYGCDVTKKEQVKAVVDATVKEHGKLDVIINNAGIMPIRPIQECNTEEWDAMVDINIKGVLYGIAAALPVFVKQNSDRKLHRAQITILGKITPPTALPRHLVHVREVLAEIAVVRLGIAALVLTADSADKIRIDDNGIGFDG